MSDFCEHGYAKRRRCPECKRSKRKGRSVYSERGLVATEEPEVQWQRLGEMDSNGQGFIDYRRATGFVPLEEFLWRR